MRGLSFPPGSAPLPRAILFDLDDTLIDIYRNPRAAWRQVVGEVLPAGHGALRDALGDAVHGAVSAHLAAPGNRRAWRLMPDQTRAPVIAGALTLWPVADDILRAAEAISARYIALRRERMALHEGAWALLTRLAEDGVRLGLVTNGAEKAQRDKLAMFGLEGLFGAIHIEGEAGFGKPDPRAFLQPLTALGVSPEQAWMVGDDVYYDIVPAHKLGLHTVLVGDKPSPLLAPALRHARVPAIGALPALLGLAD